MNEITQVLEIEKKYEHIISKAQNSSEKKLSEKQTQLEENYQTKKKELQSEFKTELSELQTKLEESGKKDLEKATTNAKQIIQTANIDNAKNYLLEEIKNGF